MIRKYVKKPIPIEAVKLSDLFEKDGRVDKNSWAVGAVLNGTVTDEDGVVTVNTLEGPMKSNSMDDYLIRGVRGELYICEGKIFEETYEEVQ